VVSEVGAGVTDVVLGAVLVGCARWLQRTPGVHRYWALMMWSAGAGAVAGAAHHLLFAGSKRASDLSWVAVGMLVAVAISYLLAASATEILNGRLARLVIRVRVAGLIAYVALMAAVGIGRTAPLVLSESATMATIVGLWCYALHAGRPGAARILLAMAVCAASAAVFAVPAGFFLAAGGLGAPALQHRAQIPGVLLLSQAGAGGALAPLRPYGATRAG
jgi:hypothetical protein